jgi:hypothetical protein
MNGSKVIETCQAKKEVRKSESRNQGHQMPLVVFSKTREKKDSETNLLTLGTNQRALILPLKQIHNDTIVPLHVALPAFPRMLDQLQIASSFPIRVLHIRLLQHPIQILVKTVEQERDELLGVVLLISCELRCEALELLLELAWVV